jgi:hypothetical protein
MKADKAHKNFGDLLGDLICRPFVPSPGAIPSHTLQASNAHDVEKLEIDMLCVRPSHIVTVTGSLAKADGLRIALDVAAHWEFARTVDGYFKLFQDVPPQR